MSEDPTPTPEPDDVTPQDLAAANSEAAKFRRALRTAEAERDALKERWDARNRADVEKLAKKLFVDPADVWAVTSLDKMQDDDGLVDPQKAASEFERVLMSKPHWAKEPPAPPARPHIEMGARESVPHEPKVSFGDSIKKAVRGG